MRAYRTTRVGACIVVGEKAARAGAVAVVVVGTAGEIVAAGIFVAIIDVVEVVVAEVVEAVVARVVGVVAVPAIEDSP